MIYKIACVGKIKEQHFTDMIEQYRKSMDHRDKLMVCEVPDERIPQKAGDKVNAMIITAEADRLRSVIDRDDYVIAMCIEGKKTTTDQLVRHIKRAGDRDCSTVTFVIGGSLGLDSDIISRADYRMSISDMTFPHQLIRVALAEQISIVSRESYL